MSKLRLLNILKEEVTEQGYGRYFKDWKTSDGKTVGDTRGFDFTTNKPFDKDYKNPETEVLSNETEDTYETSSDNQNKFVNIAKSKLGAPYVWGSNGPNSFDCSGYIRWVFKEYGGSHFGIPRTAHAMYQSAKKITESELMPGDLIFIDTADRGIGYVDHVMMVISPKGSDKIEAIHAEGSQGVNIESSLKSSYYKNKVYGYGRFDIKGLNDNTNPTPNAKPKDKEEEVVVIENKKETVVVGGQSYATKEWMKSQWVGSGLPTENVVFIDYTEETKFKNLIKSGNVNKIVGFSAGGVLVWDEVDNESKYDFIGLIDPTTPNSHPKSFNKNKVVVWANPDTWVGGPNITRTKKNLEKLIEGGLATKKSTSHDKMPSEFFNSYSSKL